MSSLTVRLFGSPIIERDGRPQQVDTRKAIALLAYLALAEMGATVHLHALINNAGVILPQSRTVCL